MHHFKTIWENDYDMRIDNMEDIIWEQWKMIILRKKLKKQWYETIIWEMTRTVRYPIRKKDKLQEKHVSS